MDLPTIITHSGDWTVTDPLGGNQLAEAILLQKSQFQKVCIHFF
jgi:hypothetical protein